MTGARLDRAAWVYVLDTGVEEALWPRKFAACPSVIDATYDLDVLLRDRLLPQPGGFDGFRMSQKGADANDLPRSKIKDFSYFLAELDGGHPGGQVDVTECEDRLAEVAELLGPIGKASHASPRSYLQAFAPRHDLGR
jgi:hypothetical protein